MSEPPFDASAAVAEYINLRDLKKQAEETVENFIKEHYTKRMEELNTQLLGFLQATKSDSISTPNGTAYITTKKSFTTADAREFSRAVIGGQDWDLVDFRPNKTAVEEYLAKNGALPPGINASQFTTVNIRKGK